MSLRNTVLQLFCCYSSSLVSVLNLLYFYISTSRSMCAVPNMAVFWSSLTSCFPGMLLTYFLNNCEIVPVAPIITGITFVFTFHMRCISIVRSLYFRIFSASFLITFLSPEIATSINIHVPFSLSLIMSGFICYYYYYYYYYLLQLSFHSVAVVLTLVQPKQNKTDINPSTKQFRPHWNLIVYVKPATTNQVVQMIRPLDLYAHNIRLKTTSSRLSSTSTRKCACPTIIPTAVLSLDAAQMHAIDFAIPISRYRIFHPSTPVGKNQHLLSINLFIHLQQGSIHTAYRS